MPPAAADVAAAALTSTAAAGDSRPTYSPSPTLTLRRSADIPGASFPDLYIPPLLRLGGSIAAVHSGRAISRWTTLLFLRAASFRAAPLRRLDKNFVVDKHCSLIQGRPSDETLPRRNRRR